MLSQIWNLPEKLRRITSGGKYRPEIDGLRFIAIGVVVLGHLLTRIERQQSNLATLPDWEKSVMAMLGNPGAGVLLFFAISGFILASQFIRKRQAPLSRAYLGNYFYRRVTRIEPPYFIVILGTYLLLTVANITPPDSARFSAEPQSLSASLVASLLYAHGWFYGTYPRLFPPAWSLEIEVQFYLLAPLLFYFLFVATKPRWRALMTALAAVCAINLARWLSNPHVDFTILASFCFFTVGVLLADISDRFRTQIHACPPLVAGAAGWLGLSIFLLCAVAIEHGPASPATVYVMLMAIVAMFFGALGHGSFRAFCALPWLSLIGGACYSLYLTHLQFMQVAVHLIYKVGGSAFAASPALGLWICLLLGLPATLAVGLAFYALVERPFMNPDWPINTKNAVIKSWRRIFGASRTPVR